MKPLEVASLKEAVIGLRGLAENTVFGKHDTETSVHYLQRVIETSHKLINAGMSEVEVGQIIRQFSN
jgi:hypothetical protein